MSEESYLFSLPGENDSPTQRLSDLSPEQLSEHIRTVVDDYVEKIVGKGPTDALQGKPAAFVTSASLPGIIGHMMTGLIPKVMIPACSVYVGIALAQRYPILAKKLQEVVFELSPIPETADVLAMIIAGLYDGLVEKGFTES